MPNNNEFSSTYFFPEERIESASFAGYSIIGVVSADFTFDEPYKQDNSRWVSKEMQVTLPPGTKGYFTYVSKHYLHFGQAGQEVFDRPLTQVGMLYGVRKDSEDKATVQLQADISDRNADDQWGGEITVVIVCCG